MRASSWRLSPHPVLTSFHVELARLRPALVMRAFGTQPRRHAQAGALAAPRCLFVLVAETADAAASAWTSPPRPGTGLRTAKQRFAPRFTAAHPSASVHVPRGTGTGRPPTTFRCAPPRHAGQPTRAGGSASWPSRPRAERMHHGVAPRMQPLHRQAREVGIRPAPMSRLPSPPSSASNPGSWFHVEQRQAVLANKRVVTARLFHVERAPGRLARTERSPSRG